MQLLDAVVEILLEHKRKAPQVTVVVVAVVIKYKILGIGGGSRPPSHTSGHAGPHQAVQLSLRPE